MTPIEVRIFTGMAKRAVLAGPVFVIAAYFFRGWKGGLSVGLAIGLVVALFALAAYPSTWAARVSPELLGITVVVGFALRLAAFAGLLLLLQNQPFIDKAFFVATFMIAYLSLLALETRVWITQKSHVMAEATSEPVGQAVGAESA